MSFFHPPYFSLTQRSENNKKRTVHPYILVTTLSVKSIEHSL